jgi:kynurenine--oxoglutarate transaminase/cysteine-S-conjugate beta-lyase/glutamine--phenylpyruvate transaminase
MLSLTSATAAYQALGAARPPCRHRSDAAHCTLAMPPPAETPADLFVPAQRLAGSDKPTVWGEFGQLAAETGAVNLGQGFPDWQPPEFVVEEVQTALREGYHQYTRPAGHPPLVEVLAQRYSKHLQRTIDPMSEVATTVGASQALYLTLQALVDPGDEVVLLEPAFDLYYGQVRIAGGSVVPVPLEVDETGRRWTLDPDKLDAAISPRTKLLVLNSPHNPTGKTFSSAEMEAIAEVVRRHPRLLVISDEVYKYTVYAGEPHQHFASLPGMFERTVTLSSAGKTFSITGWQTGWCIGPAHLLKPIQLMLPFVQFCVATPMQQACRRLSPPRPCLPELPRLGPPRPALPAPRRAGRSFAEPLAPECASQALSRVLSKADEPFKGEDSYYNWLQATFRHKREVLATGLQRSGIVPMEGKGGFFLMADTSALEVPDEYLRHSTAAAPQMTRDWALCRYLAQEGGVIAIPSSPFFSPNNKELAARYVRFAFCKGDSTLEEASDRIARLVGSD